MDIYHVFAGLAVSDRDRAAAWYERLFGRPADVLPNDAEAMWQLTGSANLYLVADPARAGRGIVTLAVDDLSAGLAGIAARGIVGREIEAIPGAGRKCMFVDPDGNAVALVELVRGT